MIYSTEKKSDSVFPLVLGTYRDLQKKDLEYFSFASKFIKINEDKIHMNKF